MAQNIFISVLRNVIRQLFVVGYSNLECLFLFPKNCLSPYHSVLISSDPDSLGEIVADKFDVFPNSR